MRSLRKVERKNAKLLAFFFIYDKISERMFEEI